MKKRLHLTFIITLIFSTHQIFAQITAYPDTTICSGDSVTLNSTAAEYCGDCYTYEQIDYAPEDIGGDDVTMVDDTWAGPFDIGFSFCFFGNTFTQFYVCSNGWISFDMPTDDMAVNWTPDGPVPDAAPDVPKNAIYGPWEDWHTGLCTGCVKYQTIGTSPNQKLIVTWDEVPMFLCTTLLGTFQIVLNETTNYIDNHLTSSPSCPAWENGYAIQGLQNEDGTIAFTVADRNYSVWSADSESYRWYTTSITWYDGLTVIGSGPSVNVAPTVTTTYTVVQTNCDGTTFSDDVTVTVVSSFDATLTTTDIFCNGDDNGTATVTVGPGSYTYDWSTGATGSSVTGLNGGDYSVTITSASGCQKSFDFTIYEPPAIIPAVSNIIGASCFGVNDGSATVTATGGSGGPYTYSLNGATPVSSGDFSNLLGGDYIVTITDASGCSVTTTFTISQPEELSIDAGPDQTIILGATATINATSSTIDLIGIIWNPGTGTLGCDSNPCFTYLVSPTESTNFIVTVTDINGCSASDTVVINVIYTTDIFMPDAFSPNGDNINDFYQGIGFNIASYDMKIFNRWGEMIYETVNPGSSSGWDGKYNNTEQPLGAYTYIVIATFNTGEEVTKTGSFILVK